MHVKRAVRTVRQTGQTTATQTGRPIQRLTDKEPDEHLGIYDETTDIQRDRAHRHIYRQTHTQRHSTRIYI